MRTPKKGGVGGADPVQRRPLPATCPTLDQLSAPVPASPVVLECERPWKRAGFQNLGTTEAVSRRSVGAGKGGLKLASRLGKEQALQREMNLRDAVTRDLR